MVLWLVAGAVFVVAFGLLAWWVTVTARLCFAAFLLRNKAAASCRVFGKLCKFIYISTSFVAVCFCDQSKAAVELFHAKDLILLF